MKCVLLMRGVGLSDKCFVFEMCGVEMCVCVCLRLCVLLVIEVCVCFICCLRCVLVCVMVEMCFFWFRCFFVFEMCLY